MSDPVKFVLVHRIDPTEEFERDDPWLEYKAGMDDDERAELLTTVLQRVDPTLTDEKLVNGTAKDIFVGPLEGVELSAIECWDVHYLDDDDEQTIYRLWLFFENQGLLVHHETKATHAMIAHCIFRPDSEHLDYWAAEELAAAFRVAQKKALRLHKETTLANVEF
jgi:hypothetical protein